MLCTVQHARVRADEKSEGLLSVWFYFTVTCVVFYLSTDLI